MGEKQVENNDWTSADRYFSLALQVEPTNTKALSLRGMTRPFAIAEFDKELGLIEELKEKLKIGFKSDSMSNAKLLQQLNEQYYQFIYHTIAIEGNTLTYNDVRNVIITGKAPVGADVSELSEIVGMEAAIKLVNRTIPHPITEKYIKDLHSRILGPVDPDNAGTYRQGPVYVGSFVPPPAEHVPNRMNQFGQFLKSPEFLEMNPIRKAAYIHHQFTWIHPFA